MNGLPYYKAYPRDFIEGTIGMPFELKAAYRLVLDLIYMQGGKLPDDARYISGLLGCTIRKWNSLRGELISLGKIEINGEFLTNKRAIIELETSRKLTEKQSENRSKPNKNKDLKSPRCDHTDTDINITSSLRSDVSAGAKKKSPKEVLQTVLSQAHATAVVDHRQRIRKPLTEHAAELLAKKLAAAPTTCGMTPEQAADFMILRGWQSFDPEWAKNATPVSQPVPGPVDEARWNTRLKYARTKKCWSSTDWGPAPGQGGCLVPSHLLEPSDGQGWSEYQNAA